MRKLRKREFVLLLLPALLLAGFALFVGRRDNNKKPFKLVVREVRKGTLTPLEVAEGFDTGLTVVLGHTGDTPDWWGKPNDWRKPPVYNVLESLEGPRGLFCGGEPFRTAPDDIRGLNQLPHPFSKEEDAYLIRYAMRVNKVPAKAGRVVFKARLRMTSEELPPKPLMTTIASVPVSVVVRQGSEKIKPPLVSKRHPFGVLKTVMYPMARSQSKEFDVMLTLKYAGPKDRVRVAHLPDKPNAGLLVDSHGKIYTSYQTTERVGSGGRILYFPVFIFDARNIPSKGKLTFKTKISVDDCWPLEVSQVVRR